MPKITIIDGWVYIRVGKITWIVVCTEKEIETATLSEFASMVVSSLGIHKYEGIKGSCGRKVH